MFGAILGPVLLLQIAWQSPVSQAVGPMSITPSENSFLCWCAECAPAMVGNLTFGVMQAPFIYWIHVSTFFSQQNVRRT